MSNETPTPTGGQVELQPCPFCGSSDLEFKTHEHRNLNSFWETTSLRCRCGGGASHGSKESVIKGWNARATHAELAALREEVENLRAWKESQMAVMREINLQAVGKLTGAKLGGSVLASIQPFIEKQTAELSALRATNAGLVEAVEGMVEAWTEQFGGQCDCRPEPENEGHVCQLCKAHAALDAAKGGER